jgi:hypothetical protein
VRNRLGGAVLVVAIVSAGAVTAAAAPVEVPSAPQVSVPSVPQVPVPPVSVPEVPVPSVPAPVAPVAPAPQVQVPVPVPAAPSVEIPAAGSVAAAAGGAASAGGTRSVGPTVEAVADRIGPVGYAGGSGDEGDFSRSARERKAQRANIKRLRRKLRPIRDCLHLLARRPRRAIVLHLGLGDARPRSRQAVARRMRTSRRHVRGMERRSFARLRRADRAGACDGAATTTAVLGFGDAAGVAFALAGFSPGGDDGAAPAVQVLGARESGGGGSGDADGEAGGGGQDADRPIGLVDTAAEDLRTIALILGGLLVAGVAVAFVLARLRRPDRPLK